MNAASATPVTGRREARRIDRRDAMLAIAAESFLRDGYAATTMSAIAAAIGGSKATLWSYFPSKEALFEAVLDRQTAAYRMRLTTLLDPSGDLEPGLRGFCLSFIERIVSPEAIALHRLAHAEASRFPELGAIFYDRAPRTVQGMLASFIASMMERDRLRKADPARAARTLMTLCLSGCHQQVMLGQLAQPSKAQLAEDADYAADIFLRAYAP